MQIPFIDFQSWGFEGLILDAGLKSWDARCEVQILCSSGRSSELWSFLPVADRCAKGGVYGEIVSRPLLPVLMWVFFPCLPNVWEFLLWFGVSFRGNSSVCSCRFNVSMGELSSGPSYVAMMDHSDHHYFYLDLSSNCRLSSSSFFLEPYVFFLCVVFFFKLSKILLYEVLFYSLERWFILVYHSSLAAFSS